MLVINFIYKNKKVNINFNSWKKIPSDDRQPSNALKFNRQPSKSAKFNRQSYTPIEALTQQLGFLARHIQWNPTNSNFQGKLSPPQRLLQWGNGEKTGKLKNRGRAGDDGKGQVSPPRAFVSLFPSFRGPLPRALIPLSLFLILPERRKRPLRRREQGKLKTVRVS